VDEPDGGGRTTATLLASLGGRLAVLHAVTGADAVGALLAGFAALGREVGATASGARLREGLEAGLAGANADRLWSALLLDRWTGALPPSPVLDHLRNDLALLLADDVDETLDLPPVPPEPAGRARGREPQPTAALDTILGLWAYARELVAGVEAAAAPTLPAAERVLVAAPATAPTTGPLLR
jgi:hypothetical protein